MFCDGAPKADKYGVVCNSDFDTWALAKNRPVPNCGWTPPPGELPASCAIDTIPENYNSPGDFEWECAVDSKGKTVTCNVNCLVDASNGFGIKCQTKKAGQWKLTNKSISSPPLCGAEAPPGPCDSSTIPDEFQATGVYEWDCDDSSKKSICFVKCAGASRSAFGVKCVTKKAGQWKLNSKQNRVPPTC